MAVLAVSEVGIAYQTAKELRKQSESSLATNRLFQHARSIVAASVRARSTMIWLISRHSGVDQYVFRTTSVFIEDRDALRLSVSRASGFRHHGVEVHSGSTILASMKWQFLKSWNPTGVIVAGQSEYGVDTEAMRLGSCQVATFKIKGRRVELFDCSSGCQFELRRKWILSGKLVLLENDLPVAEYVPNLWQSKYRVTARKETPQLVILLSVWIVMCYGRLR